MNVADVHQLEPEDGDYALVDGHTVYVRDDFAGEPDFVHPDWHWWPVGAAWCGDPVSWAKLYTDATTIDVMELTDRVKG